MLYLKTYLMGILRMKHKSVLLKECIDNLNIKVDGVYVDATLGFGGHSLEILKRINKGFLFAFDQDSEAIMYSSERLKDYDNFKIIKSNFSNMKECLLKENVRKVDGILFDIGVSSMQLDEDYRGCVIVALHNDSDIPQLVEEGERIAQIIAIPYLTMEFKPVDILNPSIRGEGGFGSTGTN